MPIKAAAPVGNVYQESGRLSATLAMTEALAASQLASREAKSKLLTI
jgi:hypothetical protein